MVTHGNNIIPNISMVVASYSYYVFPSDTFTDPDAGDTISTYSAAGLPKGVYFASSSRQIYGQPSLTAAVGDYPVTVWATSSDGTKDSLTFTLHLGPRTAEYGGVPTFIVYPTADMLVSDTTPPVKFTATDPQGVYPSTGGLAQNPYSIVWSSVNNAGDAYGTNKSPFSIDSQGNLYISDIYTIDQDKYEVIVEARDVAVGTAPYLQSTVKATLIIDDDAVPVISLDLS